MFSHFRGFLSLFAFCVTLAPAPTQASEPTTQPALVARLVSLAPRITGPSQAVTRAAFGGHLNDPYSGKLDFYVAFDERGRMGLRLQWADGTPVLLCADGKMLLYDASEGRVFYSGRSGYTFRVTQDADREYFDFGMRMAAPDAERQYVFDVDLGAFFRNTPSGLTAEALGADRYLLHVVSKRGDPATITIDMARREPYECFETIDRKTKEPYFTLARILINQAVDEAVFEFPDIEALRGRVTVVDWTRDWKQGDAASRRMADSLYYRQATRVPLLRAHVQSVNAAKGDIDWKEIARRDAEVSEALRAAVSTVVMAPRPER